MARALPAAAVAALLACALAAPTGADDSAPANAIQAENAQTGTTAWRVQRNDNAVALYGSRLSALPGDAIDFHVSTASRYRLVVYRLGWYRGSGARLLACLPSCSTDEQGQQQKQPGPPPLDATAPAIRAGWPVTDTVQTRPDWMSGYYLVEALLTSGPAAGQVGTTFFILRAPSSQTPSQILVQVPVNTWEAYNHWGGASLYDSITPRMYRVSFQRPFDDQAQSPFWWEIQLVRFLEREGYDVSYQTDADTDANPASLLNHRLVIDAGHDEYWTYGMRHAFDNALAAGTNLAFMGANDAYWHAEYQDGGDTLFTYKSLYDPIPPLRQKTAMWRQIGEPECMLEGVSNVWVAVTQRPLDYTVTTDGADDDWFAGTGFQAGDTVAGVVGREHDMLNPFPSSCVHPGLEVLFHYDGGGVDQNADAVKFTAPNGARVFAAGAMSFSWALDDFRSYGLLAPAPPGGSAGASADPRLQQFVRNAFDDLTRPAPPANVTAAAAAPAGQLDVTVSPSTDPRVMSFAAGLQMPSGSWRPVCQGVTSCTGVAPRTAGVYEIRVDSLDRWGRHSQPRYSIVVVQ